MSASEMTGDIDAFFIVETAIPTMNMVNSLISSRDTSA